MSELRTIRPSERRVNPETDTTQINQSKSLRRYQFEAVDKGFGIDTEALMERSQRLHSHHRGKSQSQQESVILTASPDLSTLSRSVALSSRQRIQSVEKPSQLLQPQIQTRMPEPPAIQTVPLQARPITAPIQENHLRPPIGNQASSTPRAFAAFLADLCVPSSLFAILLLTQNFWQTGWNRTLSQWAMQSNSWLAVQNLVEWLPLLPVLCLTIFLTFFTQLVCVLLGRNSFGRSLCGLTLAQKNNVTSAFFIALFESITFGGLATFPMLLVIPNRLPLFPWIRFKPQFRSH